MNAREIIRGLLDEMYKLGIDEETVSIACDHTGVGESARSLLPLLKEANMFVNRGEM